MGEPERPVTEDVIAQVELLSRSPNRVEILELLLERGRVDKRELAEDCDVVRTTLGRNLETLAAEDLIRRVGVDTYELTPVGEEIARGFVELVETTQAAQRLAPLLKWLPTDAFDLDLGALSDAELVVSESSDPYAPVNRHVEALREAERFRGVMAVVGQHSLEVAHERIVEAGADHELVLSEGAAETVRHEAGYGELLSEVLETGNCRLFVTGEPIPFYLGLVDDRVQIGVEDGEGIPRALAVSESSEVFAWARERYRAFRAGAERLA